MGSYGEYKIFYRKLIYFNMGSYGEYKIFYRKLIYFNMAIIMR